MLVLKNSVLEVSKILKQSSQDSTCSVSTELLLGTIRYIDYLEKELFNEKYYNISRFQIGIDWERKKAEILNKKQELLKDELLKVVDEIIKTYVPDDYHGSEDCDHCVARGWIQDTLKNN